MAAEPLMLATVGLFVVLVLGVFAVVHVGAVRRGTLSGPILGGLGLAIAFVAVSSLVVTRFDEIKNIRLQHGSDVVQLERRVDQVAKETDETRRLAFSTAAFTVSSILSENRFVGLDDEQRMLRRRDELQKFLRGSGVDDATSASLLQRITTLVDWDFRVAILSNAIAAWHPARGEDPTDPRRVNAFEAKLRNALQQSDRRAALAGAERIIRDEHVASEALSASIKAYRQMLESNQLPGIGPVDDLRRAPIN